jgi:PAS domain S-box-containing protein
MTNLNPMSEIETICGCLQGETRRRGEAEERYRNAKEEWERTFDAIDDFVTILDPDLRIVRMNRTIAESFQIDRETANNVHCYELFWGKHSPCRQCPASLVLKDRKTHRTEFKNRRLDKTFLVSASPIFGIGDRLIGMVYVTRDITDRRRAEDALRKAHDKLEMMVSVRTAKLMKANLRLREEIAERKRTEALLGKQAQELDAKSRTLEEANIALRVMLKAREEDRKELEERVLSNIRELAFPYLTRLKNTRLTPEQSALLDVLRTSLEDVISPFSRRLASKYLNLTPQEILIADLIKGGQANKEISEILCVAPRTVEFHRENIRKKLGLKNRKTNLRSHLLSLE